MVLGLATTVSAANVTIPDNLSGHSFVAYQIFTGTQADSEGDLGDVKWGADIDEAAFLAKLQAAYPAVFTAEVDAALEVAAKLADSESVDAKKVAQLAYECMDGSGTALKAGEDNALADGYYLIVDTNLGSEADDIKAYNSALLQITDDITITVKTDVPEVEKKVKDTNDSTGTTTDWQDSADYDIGDTVPFQLTATLPNNYADYSVYKLVFKDTFTHFENVTITAAYLANANGAKVADFAAGDYNYAATSNGFNVTFANLKTSSIAAQIGNSMKIVVEYTAVLSNDAAMGVEGNPNIVKLEYSNNPNWTPEYDNNGNPENPEDTPTGETPEDKVIVFTYKVVVNKTDKAGNALQGAGFTLYKKNAAGEYIAIGQELKGDTVTTFVWERLDDGDYKLVETTTPAGYNTIEDIFFTITAEHDALSDNPALTNLSGDVTSGEAEFTASEPDGSLTTDVVNQAGTTLPETGGMGTTLFYAIGGLLVAAAVVLLVTKKRMASAE